MLNSFPNMAAKSIRSSNSTVIKILSENIEPCLLIV